MQVRYIILGGMISKVMPLINISVIGIIHTIISNIVKPGMKVRLKGSIDFLVYKNCILCTVDIGPDKWQSLKFEINIGT